jgi:hypothetical protein
MKKRHNVIIDYIIHHVCSNCLNGILGHIKFQYTAHREYEIGYDAKTDRLAYFDKNNNVVTIPDWIMDEVEIEND